MRRSVRTARNLPAAGPPPPACWRKLADGLFAGRQAAAGTLLQLGSWRRGWSIIGLGDIGK